LGPAQRRSDQPSSEPRSDLQPERVEKLREILLKAGLLDRVRIGAPAPATHRTREEGPTPGAEEAFSPDALLRPTSHPPGEGQLLELIGERSSGKTALAYRLASFASARGELIGWIDLPNALDPRFLQRAGVRLEDVLWVRPPQLPAALRTAELLIKTGFGLIVLDLENVPARELARLHASVFSRLGRALRESRATALLLGAHGAAGSFATLGARVHLRRALFDRGLFEGLSSELEVVRRRSGSPESNLSFSVHHRA
jgi:hypothetical protein